MTASSQAQVTSDGTLSTPTVVNVVTSSDERNFIITGGSRVGDNLFHSFDEFSVPSPKDSAHFNNALDVQNIISRVTGRLRSEIDGRIQTNGNANLLLINPNGIIFGASAKLAIGGSFLASTANSLLFEDGTFFSTTDRQSQPLLTMSVPIGLQFGETSGHIINRSQAIGEIPFTVGLQVPYGKTLALVGGNILLEGGGLTAQEGRIELGSVANSGLVRLNPSPQGWVLEYQGIQNFGDIRLSQNAFVNTTGAANGAIQLQGRQIAITESSQVAGRTLRGKAGESISINASELVEVSDFGSISTLTFGTGDAGGIIINTGQLIVRDGGSISTSAQKVSSGQAGNISVDASDSVKVRGNRSFLAAQTFTTNETARGSGDIKIKTNRLIVQEGGRITNSTFGAGNAGNLMVDASLVEVSGRSEDGASASGLFAQSSGGKATGDAGNLEINTRGLIVRDGASISVGAVEETFRGELLGVSAGQGGEMRIDASDFVAVTGTGIDNQAQIVPSTLLSESHGPGNAGNLTIKTDTLIVRDGARVSVSSRQGQAGNVDITANSLFMNRGSITAETRLSKDREGANINLQVSDLLLLGNESLISATAFGNADGGNININTRYLIALPSQGANGSDIIANAEFGDGGRIEIAARRIFGIESRPDGTPFNDITASSEFGTDGVVEINTLEFEPQREELPANLVDVSSLINQNLCKAGQGSQFTLTGRGGLPHSPNEAFSSDDSWEDWRIADASQPTLAGTTPAPRLHRQQTIVEAQGWLINPQGKVVLTSEPIVVVPRAPVLTASGC
jgi:filamentous hemagglutinin family protein